MRVKKQKRHRKIVRFYTACFGFRDPFKVLCDGTFVHHLLVNRIMPANDALFNLLGAQAKLFTTRCVLAELKSLGESYAESFQAARNLTTARCDHERRKSAVGCIEEIIGENNSGHFFIATQDNEVRKKFQEIPGVPVIFGLRNSLFLEPPSAKQRQFAKSTEEERLHMKDWEHKILEKKEKETSVTQVATDACGAHEGIEDQIVTQTVTKTKATKVGLGLKDKVQFKRNKPKGPNPLSCKRKKNHGNPSLPPNKDGKNGEKRKRSRSRKRNKPAVSDS